MNWFQLSDNDDNANNDNARFFFSKWMLYTTTQMVLNFPRAEKETSTQSFEEKLNILLIEVYIRNHFADFI